jgi:hypothetical protein
MTVGRRARIISSAMTTAVFVLPAPRLPRMPKVCVTASTGSESVSEIRRVSGMTKSAGVLAGANGGLVGRDELSREHYTPRHDETSKR